MKQKVLFAIAISLLTFSLVSCGSTEETSNDTTEIEVEEVAETHIYDDAEVLDVLNGSGTDVIGEFSLTIADSSEITDEVLADWYFNYVTVNDYNWCVILYSDSDSNEGVYAIQGFVDKDVTLSVNETDGTYVLEDSSNATTYYPTSDNTLEAQN